jgi:hypothetical protein
MADATTRASEVIEARLAELRDEAGRLERALEELRGGRRRTARRRTTRQAATRRRPQTGRRSSGRSGRKANAQPATARGRSRTRKT